MRTEDRACHAWKCHALVVEDEAADRQLVKDIFLREGFLVDEATNGREALEKIRSRKYDVIVLDILLPYLDGYEVMRHLRSQAPEILERTVIVSRLHAKDMETFFPGCHIIQKPASEEDLARIARLFRARARPDQEA